MKISPQQTIAHYRITAKLGEGGMGEVYRATDTKLGREVAIKIIPESFAHDTGRMARFTREAHVLASLNHPNIAAIYGVEDNAIVMELVEGEQLRGPLPLDKALALIHQLIDALEYAHEKGVIHRDLKPANIKITPEGRVKVLDFGLAKALASDAAATQDPASSPTLTIAASEAGMILGTAAYMAPEQARGHNVDRRADIWAFGVVAWELLTGRRLFEASTVSDTLAAVLTKEPDFDGVPAKMRRLLQLCLVKDPRKRLSAIGDARLEMDEEPAPATLASRHRSRWWPAFAALFALAALALAALFLKQPPPAVPFRFQIPAPEKSSFGDYGMALSPDGRRLAFIANNPNGRPMLWVRPLDSLTAQSLPGTEGANYLPFWSPDSRFIGFVVQGTLKKVDASGGPPQTLCEVPGTLIDGSWSRAGTIIVSTPANLFKVSQAGGDPTPLTLDSPGAKSELLMRPWFLPDGRHFLYISRRNGQNNPAIYLATLDGKERKRLVSATQAGAYAPPSTSSENGHLLFLRGDTLMAQPMDPKRFELAGEPFPVAEQVGSRLAMGFFTVSANGVLAYRSGIGGEDQLAWFDRTGKSQGALGAPSLFDNGLALSPDGKRVAISQGGQTGNVDLWIIDVERGIPMRFTFDASINANPVWSPDGSRIAFASDHAGPGAGNIYVKESSGSANEELFLKSSNSTRPWDWSPDGKYLLYGLDTKTGWDDLWVLPAIGNMPGERKPRPYLQTPFNEIDGQFSPGPPGSPRWIAYSSDESGPYQIYVQSFPAGAGKFQVSTGGGTQPRWRRDGKELFYIAADRKLMAVDVKTAPRFEASPATALFDTRIVGGPKNFHYDVSADGKRFLIDSASAAAEGSTSAPITVVVNWNAAK